MLAQRQERGQPGVELAVRYGYEAFAGFYVVQLLTDGIPLLLFSDLKAVPAVSPWSLCVNDNLGSMEANVMAGRALFGGFQLPDGPRCCAIFLVQEKVMQGTSRSTDFRAYRRIAPKSLELVLVSRPVASAFCGRLLVQQPALLVFAQANPARLPLTMGIPQPNIPVRRMMTERRTKLTDASVRELCRLLTPLELLSEVRMMSACATCSATPGWLPVDEDDIIAKSVMVSGCHTQSRSSRQCSSTTLRSRVVSLSISGGEAIAATLVVPGKQSNSLSTLWIANPVHDPPRSQVHRCP